MLAALALTTLAGCHIGWIAGLDAKGRNGGGLGWGEVGTHGVQS